VCWWGGAGFLTRGGIEHGSRTNNGKKNFKGWVPETNIVRLRSPRRKELLGKNQRKRNDSGSQCAIIGYLGRAEGS